MVQINSIRAPSVWMSVLAALLGGIAVSAILNYAEKSGIPGASDFGNYFGLWIIFATVIAAWSWSLRRAMLHATVFLLAMIGTYYVSTLLLSGYLLTRLLLAWIAIALSLTPPFAALAWHARGTGWLSALGAAAPIGLLLHEALSLRVALQLYGVNATQVALNSIAAVVLFLILPADFVQRVRVLVLTPLIVLSAGIVLDFIVALVYM